MDSHEQNRREARTICLILLLGTLAVFGGVVTHDFVDYDDGDYVTENNHVQGGPTPGNIVWAFTHSHASNWHPLTWMSHMLDCQLFGLKAGGHHLTSLLFHVANTLLLFGVLRRMTGATWRSAMVAALFAWHPLHVESVAWVAERKDVLSTFFGLLTLLAYTRYVEESRVRGPKSGVWYRRALLFFALGLMSKPMLVTLPFVLLLLDYWPLSRIADCGLRIAESGTDATPVGGNIEDEQDGGGSSVLPLKGEETGRAGVASQPVIMPADQPRLLPWNKLVAEKVPFFVLVLISSVLTFLVQKKGGAMVKAEDLPIAPRIGNALLACAGYLRKMIWPGDLTVFYPFPPTLPVPHIAVAALLLVMISIAAITLVRRRPYVLIGWLWFLGMLVPVIGLVQVGAASMADRYTYLPLVGIFIALTWGVADLAGGGWLRNPKLGWVMAVPVLAACLALTRVQVGYWKNSVTLFTHALAVTANNTVAHINLGRALDDVGRTEEAKAQFTAALELEPDSPLTLNNFGILYARQGDLTNALHYYNSALRSRPFFADAHYNLGNVLVTQGKLQEAAEQYAQSLSSKPESPDALNNLGAVLMRLGRPAEAAEQFKAALRLKSAYPEAQDQLGGALLKLGHADLALFHYAEAVRLKPDFAHAQLKLGLLLAQQGRLEEAKLHLRQAVQLAPTNTDAYYNLASVCEAQGRLEEAAAGFAQLLRLKPEDADAHGRLGSVLAGQGKTLEAIAQYREAVRLKPDGAEALKELAWLLATSAKAETRNGAEALGLAERACGLTGRREAGCLAALDAAYAETGHFEEAIRTAQEAQAQAEKAGQGKVAEKAARRLESYRAGKPWRE